MKNLTKHETTIQEEIVFQIACAILKELGFEGEVHKNIVVPIGRTSFVPDIYIPKLSLVISVNGRIHEHGYENRNYWRQQCLDKAKDYVFKRAGIDILVIHNFETANRGSLAVRLRSIFNDLMKRPPSKDQLNFTRKLINKQREQIRRNSKYQKSEIKTGVAGNLYGYKIYHHFYGFKVIMRKKRS